MQSAGYPESRKLEVAVVGSGISGLSAAWLLSKRHRVTLYEANSRIGGHSNTVDVDGVAVDTGFIVYNEATYPNFSALLEHLGVASKPTNMTFAVSLDDGRLEYSGTGLKGLFAQPRNAISLRFLGMLRDLVRFYREGAACGRCYGRYIARRLSRCIRLREGVSRRSSLPDGRRNLVDAGSEDRGISGPSLCSLLREPRSAQVGQPSLSGEPWQAEAAPMSNSSPRRSPRSSRTHPFQPSGVIWTAWRLCPRGERPGASIMSSSRRTPIRPWRCWPTQLRGAPAARSFRLFSNSAVLHADATLMPRRRRVWSSWNYMSSERGNSRRLSVSYWMNSLQGLPNAKPMFLTLNAHRPIREDLILYASDYTHPIFNARAMKAQRQLWSLQGRRNTWFCGAHFGAGFHEDGLQAGLAVAEALGGSRRPWVVSNESGASP